MKTIILSILCLAVLIGCNDTPSSPNQSVLTSEFYPLEVGNTWKYLVTSISTGDTTDIYSLTVESTETINGKVYFKIANSSEIHKRAVTYSYQRVENDKVYIYDNFFENLSIDFTSGDSTAGYVYGVTDSVGTAIGAFDSVYLVRSKASEFDGAPYESYALKVGLIFRSFQRTTSEIIYAKIGDKIYK
ncbi:MAG: hypothetical protein HYZ54_11285 [Ignavibacteriae bacterium]|nr:hypothetical protein [Ignavibacteriota bacterium]